MGRANNSSVDTTKGDRLAKKWMKKKCSKSRFCTRWKWKKEQIVNARKAANVDAQKEKRKRTQN